MSRKDLIYIYNLEQAYFYIREKLTPLFPPDINPNSGKVYFVFDKVESNSIYTKWLEKTKQYKNNI
jgi:hypothetical protein